MELWVRSQNKKILTKVDSLILTNTGDIKSGNDIDTGITLASYCPNYQRALEVLDEIHQRLINLQCIELIGAANITQQMKRNGVDCVYEMPKE